MVVKDIKVILFVIPVFFLLCGSVFGGTFSATKRTDSAYYKCNTQLQVVSDKIYYVWIEENDSSNHQIWTGEMNTDGSGWSATKRTTSAFIKDNPQLQVIGGKIYYVWFEEDDSSEYQIWTAEMNTNGTGWSATKRTTSAYDKYWIQFQVVENRIYYVWSEDDDVPQLQIWTAVMNTDGTGWAATKRTTSAYDKMFPQLQVNGDRIYYVWSRYLWGGPPYDDEEIWTAGMNTNGTGWSATKRTTSGYEKWRPQLQVVENRIYYVWSEPNEGSIRQIWTAKMNKDGTGWTATQRTTSAHDKYAPQFQVVGRNIHYVWGEDDGANSQIWTAVEILPFPEGMILLLLGD